MISILERLLPPDVATSELFVTYQDVSYRLTRQWGLVSRAIILDNWRVRGGPKLSDDCCYFSFDELVESFGGKLAFNAALSKLIQRDFYTDWEITFYDATFSKEGQRY